jgi:hypothetical protein
MPRDPLLASDLQKKKHRGKIRFEIFLVLWCDPVEAPMF